MSSSTARRRPRLAPPVLAGGLLAASFLMAAWVLDARALPEILAVPGPPSSVTARYGAARPLPLPSGTSLYAIPTEWGIEIRDAATATEAPVGTFRTAGPVRDLTLDGSTAYLFTGWRGIVAVDLTNPAVPVAVGSHGDLGDVTLGAASPNGYGLAAAADAGQALHFLGRSAPGSLTRLATLTFSDGRDIRVIRARADSFLVASVREIPFPRLFLTLYRLSPGAAAPESLREIGITDEGASDLAWVGDVAFVANGDNGVLAVNLVTGSRRNYPVAGFRTVRSVDADEAWVVAVASVSTLARFQRVGAAGDSLANYIDASVTLDPLHVTLHGTRVLVSTVDEIVSVEPDEPALSQIEFHNIDLTSYSPPIGGTGRVRRVVWEAGYAYLADYTGGLRIYRADGADTSLVGVLPIGGVGRVVDLAVDPARKLAYLASGSPGLQIVDVADPTNPALLAVVPLPGRTSSVAVAAGNLVLVGRRGVQSGVTIVDTALPGLPATRGQVAAPAVLDPRSIAIRGTIAFVADETLGLFSIDFSDPDQPILVGTPTGYASRDLHLAGNLLLVATRSAGLQIVDVFDPTRPNFVSSILTPPILGVGRSGNSAILCLGEEGMLVADIGDPSRPSLRGPVAVPGIAEDATWVGDTLLVAASLALERLLVAPTGGSVAALSIEVDGAAVLPRARVRWDPVVLPGAVGLNLYRDLLPSPGGTDDLLGRPLNAAMLPLSATEALDDSLTAGKEYRYRLEALLLDGTWREVAEGTIYISSNQALGRPFPNPFRPGSGSLVTLPFRLLPGARTLGLDIFDVAGRLVRNISLGSFSGGFGLASWDGRNSQGRTVPDGVYYMRISSPGFDEGRTLVVLH